MTSTQEKLDVVKNRKTTNWSRREQAVRVLWATAQLLFRMSPRIFWGWRRSLLRAFGAQVGADVHVYPSVRITMPWNLTLGRECAIGDRAILYALGPISISDRATVSQGAHLCAGTHDLTRLDRPLVKATITIEADAWVAADAFIGPGVTVGRGAVVGARAVVAKDIEAGWIVVGNPARPLRKL
jgi:putative colanic acid biosynthesis acetyltransferase WcaF